MRVSIVRTESYYPQPPFHPSEAYPEYPYTSNGVSAEKNPVYAAVRQALYHLGLDEANYGSPSWNPLGDFIREGSRIILKPNFVNHYNPLSDERQYFEALVTQGAVMRALMDYVLIAARGSFTLTFMDLPIQSADFDVLRRKTGLDRVIELAEAWTHGRGSIECLDLRDYRLVTDRSGAVLDRVALPGDLSGYVQVDLGESSSLVEIEKDAHLFRAPDYNGEATTLMHSGGRHQYILPRTVLESDFFVNLPKLKVHRKVGVTLCLKNLVGVIGDKACLPHYRAGAPDTGGDEHAVSCAVNSLRSRLDFALRSMGQTVWSLARPLGKALVHFNRSVHGQSPLIDVRNGDWYGNDTLWRMVHDLNRVILYADSSGKLHDTPRRSYLALVDGIIGGEGEGPLMPEPVPSGVIVAGTDPVAVDLCCTRLMGLDWRKMPQLSRCEPGRRFAFSSFRGEPADIRISTPDGGLCTTFDEIQPIRSFKPASGWAGQIELC